MKEKLKQTRRFIFFPKLKLLFILIIVAFASIFWLLSFFDTTIYLRGSGSAIYSSNGKWIAMMVRLPDMPTVTIVDTENGNIITTFSDTLENHATFSPDSQIFLIANHQSIEVWDTNTWTLKEIIELDHWICDLEYQTSQQILVIGACGPDAVLTNDELDNKLFQQVVSFDDWQVQTIAMANQAAIGAIVLHSYPDYQVSLFDLRSGEILGNIASSARITDLVWTPDDQFLIGAGEDSIIHIWQADTLNEVEQIRQIGVVESVDISSDGNYLVAGGVQSATIYDWNTFDEVSRVGLDNILSIRFNPVDNNLLLVATWQLESRHRKTTRIYDISNIVSQ